jgi:hypothetical protein
MIKPLTKPIDEHHAISYISVTPTGDDDMTKKLNKADTKLLAEAHAAINRLTATMNAGQNRFGSYGDNCRDAIKRWEATVARLSA